MMGITTTSTTTSTSPVIGKDVEVEVMDVQH